MAMPRTRPPKLDVAGQRPSHRLTWLCAAALAFGRPVAAVHLSRRALRRTLKPLLATAQKPNLTDAVRSPLSRNQTVLSSVASPLAPNCNSTNTVWDIGFHDGTDSAVYMQWGFCVVGVEADPQKAAEALITFKDQIGVQQLAVVNAALPPAPEPGAPAGQEASSLPFYRNRCSGEWNSFDRPTGCKGGENGGCDKPFAFDKGMCDVIPVPVTPCGYLFQWYGTPLYAKLDIAGAETGCFQAMSDLGGAAAGRLPQYLSAEIGGVDYIDQLHGLGYTNFKLVRQDLMWNNGGRSGPWGWAAVDCRTKYEWRSYESVRAEMVAITTPMPNGTSEASAQQQSMASPCPRIGIGKCWYDLHVKM